MLDTFLHGSEVNIDRVINVLLTFAKDIPEFRKRFASREAGATIPESNSSLLKNIDRIEILKAQLLEILSVEEIREARVTAVLSRNI